MLRVNLNLRPEVRGKVTLGPKPGTPEFVVEQRCRALGVEYHPDMTLSDLPTELPSPEK